MKIISPCDWCGEETSGERCSGEALLGAMRTVHSKCYPAWAKQHTRHQKAIKAINDIFAKETGK